MTSTMSRHVPNSAITGTNLFRKRRFPLDIDYILCTRRAETAKIGEWTIQAPIPENLWDRQSVSGGKRWD